jgi:hypothetical protein
MSYYTIVCITFSSNKMLDPTWRKIQGLDCEINLLYPQHLWEWWRHTPCKIPPIFISIIQKFLLINQYVVLYIMLNWIMSSIKEWIIGKNPSLIFEWNNFWLNFTYFLAELQIICARLSENWRVKDEIYTLFINK